MEFQGRVEAMYIQLKIKEQVDKMGSIHKVIRDVQYRCFPMNMKKPFII